MIQSDCLLHWAFKNCPSFQSSRIMARSHEKKIETVSVHLHNNSPKIEQKGTKVDVVKKLAKGRSDSDGEVEMKYPTMHPYGKGNRKGLSCWQLFSTKPRNSDQATYSPPQASHCCWQRDWKEFQKLGSTSFLHLVC